MKKRYKVEVDCANCASQMEHAASKIPGVKDITIAFMTQKMTVDFEDGVDVDETMDAVEKACKRVESDFVLER